MKSLILILLISSPICIFGKVIIGPASDETEMDYPVDMDSFFKEDNQGYEHYESTNHVHRQKRDVTAPLVHAMNGKHSHHPHPDPVVTHVEGSPVHTQYAPLVHVKTPIAHHPA